MQIQTFVCRKAMMVRQDLKDDKKCTNLVFEKINKKFVLLSHK